ncbi:hypothetical protein GCM10011533_05890 [Streptosporangium jomthongense]|nr:hypothetical protein GCM10011533_05890 [Streptosporangium jomthongense]
MKRSDALVAGVGSFRATLCEYLSSGQLLEVVYRDSAGQVCVVHDVIRDIFSRAGQDFIFLGRGTMLPFERILTIDGQQIHGISD